MIIFTALLLFLYSIRTNCVFTVIIKELNTNVAKNCINRMYRNFFIAWSSKITIFLGDTTIGYMEVTDKEPYLIEGIRHSGEQTKGACLVPKRALNVMQGEVNRILQLTSNSVIPITYQVPRKTYRFVSLALFFLCKNDGFAEIFMQIYTLILLVTQPN